MPIDFPPPQGGIEAPVITPPQSTDPLVVAQKLQALRQANAMNPLLQQLGQQIVQGGQLDIQQKQLQLDQTHAVNQAYMGALTVGPDGTPTIDTAKLGQVLATHNAGSMIPTVLKGVTELQRSAADLAKTNNDVIQQQHNLGGDLGAAVRAANYDPHLFITLATHAVQAKAIDQQMAGPVILGVAAALQEDPSGQSATQLVKQFSDQLIQASPKQRELGAQETQGKARELIAQTGQQREAREQGQQDFQNAISALGANPPKDSTEYQQRVGQLSYAIASRIFSAVPPEQYDPQKSVPVLRQLGMTPEQQTQADAAAAKAATPQTEAELARVATDPNATPEERAAADAALKRLDESKKAARPVTNVNMGIPNMPNITTETPHGEDFLKTIDPGTATTVRAVAEGRIPLPSSFALTRPYWQQMLKLVGQYDPGFSAQRAEVRKAFTTGTDGRNIGALNTAAVHLDQLSDAAKALDNGTFTPTNELYQRIQQTFGATAPTNFATLKNAVAGEMAQALKGNATDPEIANISATIGRSSSPKQLAGVVDTGLQILHAKLNTYQERYNQQVPGGDKSWSPILPTAQQAFQKHSVGGGGTSNSTPARPSSIPANATAQYSPSLKKWRYSTDGGKTWQIQ